MERHVRKSRHIMRRVMSLILTFVILFTSVDLTAFASEVQNVSEPSAQADDTVTIHFRNTNSWDIVNLYTWLDSGSGSWPGVGMDWNEGLECYTKSISWPDGENMNIIFNNGGSSQTKDLSLSSGEIDASKEWWFFPNGSKYANPSLTVNGQSATFSLLSTSGSTVKICGTLPDAGWDWNTGIGMTSSGNVFSVTLDNLPVDVYAYKFLVDEKCQGGNNNTFGVSNQQVTLHFRNDENWDADSVYVHAWQMNNEVTNTDPKPETATAWPGNLSLENKNNYFHY